MIAISCDEYSSEKYFDIKFNNYKNEFKDEFC